VSRRGSTEASWWRRRKAARLDAPAKDHVFAAVDEQLAQRLRQMRLPEPPPALRERDRKSYDDWLNSDASRNRWRD
jgi:hypothetical protein